MRLYPSTPADPIDEFARSARFALQWNRDHVLKEVTTQS